MKKLETLRIIVAEDELRILHSIVSKIQNTIADCEVIATANNGCEALALAEKYHPDIVFSDIKMPQMDGLELAQKLRERLPDTYVILLSGFSEFSFAQEAIRYGVSYYLLKPLDEEELLEAVEDIREKLEENSNKKIPYVLLSDKNSLKLISQEENAEAEQYYVAIFCFYNLYCSSANGVPFEYYNEQLSRIDWTALMQRVKSYCDEWMVADGTPANLKNIVLTISNGGSSQIKKIVGILQSYIHESYPDYTFNICYHLQPIKREEIWNYTARIKRVLENHVVAAEEQIFILEDYEFQKNNSELYGAVKLRIQNNVKILFKTGNYQALLEELNHIVSYSLENRCSQKQLIKIVGEIFKMVEENSEWDEDEKLKNQVEKEKFYTILSLAATAEEISEAFSSLLFFCFQSHLDLTASQKSKDEIIDYVEQNYMMIDSVEQVAERFNYNYTYISRMFRNVKGVSMVKYITQKRIETSKKIMRENPELSISTVSNMVGYMDQHYFSRVFKSIMGISPKEYKNTL